MPTDPEHILVDVVEGSLGAHFVRPPHVNADGERRVGLTELVLSTERMQCCIRLLRRPH